MTLATYYVAPPEFNPAIYGYFVTFIEIMPHINIVLYISSHILTAYMQNESVPFIRQYYM